MTFPSSKNKISLNGGGLIRTIIIVVALLILLGYFGFNLREIMDSAVVKDNLIYGKEIAIEVWNNYLKFAVDFIVGLVKKVI